MNRDNNVIINCIGHESSQLTHCRKELPDKKACPCGAEMSRSSNLSPMLFKLETFLGRGRERERNVLFNDALNTFYLRLYGVRHMVKDHSDSEK